MKNSEVKSIIEALLFASPDPLNQAKVNTVFSPETYVLKDIINALNKQYLKEEHAFEIQQVAGGFQLVSKKEYEIFIRRMLSKSGKLTLSNAALDSLAIIAYRQPISRYEIEAVRGVDSSGVIKTLLGRELVKIKGRDSGPGRPLLYKTTNKFLEYFGINRLSDLPKLKEISELIEADPTLGEQISVFKNDISENQKLNENSLKK
tara:strand:+ start:915 stop:1529 length:615 start_codon:yes stop_codon:yes gene_type:complete